MIIFIFFVFFGIFINPLPGNVFACVNFFLLVTLLIAIRRLSFQVIIFLLFVIPVIASYYYLVGINRADKLLIAGDEFLKSRITFYGRNNLSEIVGCASKRNKVQLRLR